jgi:hypothetical protein
MRNSFLKKQLDNRGQGIMEYILLSSLIGIFCLLAIKNYGGSIKNQIYYLKKQVNSLPRD